MKSIIHRFIKRAPLLAPPPLSIGVFTEGLAGDTYARQALNAFAHGVDSCGDAVTLIDGLKYVPCDVAVIFGDVRDAPGKESRMRLKAEVKGRHIHRGLVVIDTAILTRASSVGGDYRRIGLNGILNGEADFANAQCPPERWKKISDHAGLNLKPWRENGTHILFALQRPVDASLKSTAQRRPERYKNWVMNSVEKILEATGRPIHMRLHPASLAQADEREWIESLRKALGDKVAWGDPQQSFSQALHDCWTCITFNSGAGVDAAMGGIPVFAGDSGSFAWEIAEHDFHRIETPRMPDRTSWVQNLAYVEWSLEEMRQGLPWRHLKPALLERL